MAELTLTSAIFMRELSDG
jgi:hypothetical protein